MLTPQFVLPLVAKLIIDLFAGGGGASTGIEKAIGRHVDIAVNHDPKALAMHQANHPQTRHLPTNVWDLEPRLVCAGNPVGLLWASPDCRHFSPAKGGAPVSDRVRSLAWVVIKWAAQVRPDQIYLENIPEFKNWGPVIAGRPCPDRKGKTFRRWRLQLTRLGYQVEFRELKACDYGAPTIRKRLFMIARCDGRPIVWPEATHGAGLLPYRTAAECIDWSLYCPSIFLSKEEGKLFGVKRPLVDPTMRRIAHGVRRHVIESANPFIVPVTHGGGADRVHSIDEPFRTITGAHRGELALAAATITRIGQQGFGDDKAQDPRTPLTTTMTKAEHVIASATLIQTGYGERPGQAPRVPGLHKPLGTAVDGQKHALVAAYLAKHYGGHEGPGIPVDVPISTITSQDHHHLVAAHLAKFRFDSDGQPLDKPAPTMTSNSHKKRPGGAPPIGLVTSHLAKLHGTSNSASVQDPLGTISTGGGKGGGHHAEVRALLLKYYGTQQDPELTEPMHTVRTKECFGLVTVKGIDYFIADIGMRMLQPRELFRAQGFDDSYIIEWGIDPLTGQRVMLTKSDQVRMCGNSVVPILAEAIVAANYSDYEQRKAA